MKHPSPWREAQSRGARTKVYDADGNRVGLGSAGIRARIVKAVNAAEQPGSVKNKVTSRVSLAVSISTVKQREFLMPADGRAALAHILTVLEELLEAEDERQLEDKRAREKEPRGRAP